MPGKNPPQSYEEIVQEGLAKRTTSRVFSTANRDENDVRLADLVTASAEELAKAADAIDTISLSDTETLKRRTMIYVRGCADAGNLPTFSGLMRSIGMTSQAGYKFASEHPNTPTGQWLTMYRDYCGDLLADAALKGMTHPVFSIFVEKSRNLWRDTISIEQVQPTDPLGAEISQDILEQKLADIIVEDE